MKHAIDANSPLPRYFQIYQSLKQRIVSGEFTDDRPLPAERQLAADYQVSRFTIVKALDQLKAEDLIDRRHGCGTFVKARCMIPVPEQGGDHSLYDCLLQQGLKPQWQLLATDWMVTPKNVVDALQLSPHEKQFSITILLTVEAEAIACHRAHIPHALALKHQLERMPAAELLTALRNNRFVTDNAPQRSIDAIAADEADATLLAIEPGLPLLAMDTLYLSREEEIEQYSRTVFRGDRFSYQL